jgi:biotin carboxyl carrier protein
VGDVDVQYQLGDEVVTLKIEPVEGAYRVSISDRAYTARLVHQRGGELIFTVDGQRYLAYVADDGRARCVAVAGETYELRRPDVRRLRRKQHRAEGSLAASMPGQVSRVLVTEGESVQRGQPLIILEAMKMEIKIAAPHAGRVAKIFVRQGQVVDRGQGLIDLAGDL